MVRPSCIILAALAALTLACAACSTPPRAGARDPEIWRPVAPAVYPLPR